MASTPADVKELPNKYTVTIDMPGVKAGDVSVRVEDENVLVIKRERKREGGEEGMKYLRMERRMCEFMRKFVLPENAGVENGITAECKEGVLIVNIIKKPPPEPKKPKTIQEDSMTCSRNESTSRYVAFELHLTITLPVFSILTIPGACATILWKNATQKHAQQYYGKMQKLLQRQPRS